MQSQLQEWINYIQQPGKLGNSPICPYAAKAVKEKKVDITALADLQNLEEGLLNNNLRYLLLSVFKNV